MHIYIYINIIHDVYLNQQQPHPPWFSGDLSEAKKAAQEAASAASGDVAGWLRHREHWKIRIWQTIFLIVIIVISNINSNI